MPSPGDRPRPWAALLWPFLWVYLAIIDKLERRRRRPEPPKAAFQLWGRDGSLLWSSAELPQAISFEDRYGIRHTTKIVYLNE